MPVRAFKMNSLIIFGVFIFHVANAKAFTDSSQLVDDGCDHFRKLHGTTYSWSCESSYFCPKENLDVIKELHSLSELFCDPIRNPNKICCPKTFLIGNGAGIIAHNSFPPPRTSLFQESKSFSSYSTSSLSSGTQSEIQRPSINTSPILRFYSPSENQFFELERFGDNRKHEPFPVPQNVYVDCGTIDAVHLKDNFTWTCQKRPCKELPQSYFVKKDLHCSSSDESKICCPEFAKEIVNLSTRPPSGTRAPVTSSESVHKGVDFGTLHKDQGAHVKEQPVIFDYVHTNTIKPNPLATPDQTSDEALIRRLRSKKYSKFDRELLTIISQGNENSNVVVSPASIRALLALLVEGSAGNTSDEILQILQIKQADRHLSVLLLRKVQSMLKSNSANITLESQNRIYKANDVNIREDYDSVIKNIYGTGIETLDFSNPEHASSVINTWVKNVTHGLIPSLVEKDSLRTDLKMFLINYIYLKANWDMEFDPFATHTGCFYNSKRESCQQVNFMTKKRLLNYTDSSAFNAEIFEIPFKDSRYRVVFVLPHEGKDVHDVLKSLEREDLFDLLNKLETTSVNLQLPRTTIEFSSNMVQILQKLGIKSVFGPTANLNRMVKNSTRLAVNDIIHKARIEINEEGTKAAGVSGGGVVVLSLDMYKKILVDRPFMFFIRDTMVSGILFEGIVFSPDKADTQ